ncbi:DUF6082 family protein [Actinoplanes aureus]|uniref:Uncharacterized protein n=1 Tax=Actinoplanes aureus TaxID=2792083 RepID=A0A931G3S3_9ACTN|nr:DUF6082 family protein [Actinoplanes aureus]MBG0567256.1 hypothetical protein [Actinoplanes aureus]
MVVIAVALSPLVLAAAGEAVNLDWQHMSDIGQAYGAAAAVFSALAFTAVAVSIAYQARAVNQQHFQAVRGFQWELLNMVADEVTPTTHGSRGSSMRSTARLWRQGRRLNPQ